MGLVSASCMDHDYVGVGLGDGVASACAEPGLLSGAVDGDEFRVVQPMQDKIIPATRKGRVLMKLLEFGERRSVAHSRACANLFVTAPMGSRRLLHVLVPSRPNA